LNDRFSHHVIADFRALSNAVYTDLVINQSMETPAMSSFENLQEKEKFILDNLEQGVMLEAAALAKFEMKRHEFYFIIMDLDKRGIIEYDLEGGNPSYTLL
jgi:hypothetical protein